MSSARGTHGLMNAHTELPLEVVCVAQLLARKARAYSGILPWEEEQMFMGDLNNNPRRWASVDPAAFHCLLVSEGVRPTDSSKVVNHLRRHQSGAVVRPHELFKDYRLCFDTTAQIHAFGTRARPWLHVPDSPRPDSE